MPSIASKFVSRTQSEPLAIKITYDGESFAGGTMPIEQVVLSLQGFAEAYGKVAAEVTPGVRHELKIAALTKGSFELNILAIVTEPHVVDVLKASGVAVATIVIERIKDYVLAKKHVDNKPYTTYVAGDNNITLIADNGSTINIAPETYRLFREKALDAGLEKVVAPLPEDSIDRVRMDASEEPGFSILGSEKHLFGGEGQAIISAPVKINVQVRSHSRRTNSGRLALKDGRTVPYKYVGDNPELFALDYGFGSLLVEGDGYFDDSARLVHMNIRHSSRLHQVLPFEDV